MNNRLTINEVIRIADLSTPLALNYNEEGALFGKKLNKGGVPHDESDEEEGVHDDNEDEDEDEDEGVDQEDDEDEES